MTASLILACLWAIIASVVAMVPRRFHWPGVVVMVVTGIPLLGWVTWQNGPLWGMLVLAGGASMLRWPVVPLARRLWRGGVRRRNRRNRAGLRLPWRGAAVILAAWSR